MSIKRCKHCGQPATRERKNILGTWVALCGEQHCLSAEWQWNDKAEDNRRDI